MRHRMARNMRRRERLKATLDRAFMHLPWAKPPRYKQTGRVGRNLTFHITGKTTEGVWLRFNATLECHNWILGNVMSYLRAARKEQ